MIDYEKRAREMAVQAIRDLVDNEEIWSETYEILREKNPDVPDVMDLPDDAKEEVFSRLAEELEEIAAAMEM